METHNVVNVSLDGRRVEEVKTYRYTRIIFRMMEE